MTRTRKLAAILSADVFGYSRLMSENEEATVAALQQGKQVLSSRVGAQGGRVVDATGDALLAEFPSAMAAVTAAVEVQRELATQNASLPEGRRMLWRIGVNLGDVIDEGGVLYGDGVNIAARLQSLTAPGGVCVSGTVFEQVEGKLPLRFQSGGEQSVKNIAKPVRVFHAVLDEAPGVKPAVRNWRVPVVAVVMLAIAGAGWLAWQRKPARAPQAPEPAASVPHDPILTMPTGPRVAVLPLANMSGNPKEDYFADGLTEDIITELSRFREIYVLARNTTYQYKGQAVDVPAIGQKLGVQYVLEGSVRRAGKQVRITAQLIDVKSGAHLWAEKYDRDMRDIFVVQDELAQKIAGSIAGGYKSALQAEARKAVEQKSPQQLKAYDHVLRASLVHEWWSPAGYPKAKAELQQALALDPTFSRAHQVYAWQSLIGWIFRYEKSAMPPKQIKENAIRSVELDPSNPLAHLAAAFGYYFDKQFELFEREAATAMELAPNDPDILAPLGFLIAVHGRWERGVQLANKTRQLNAASAGGWMISTLFYDYHRRGMYREALEVLKQHPNPGIVENLQKYTAVYAELGELDRAREYWEKCRQIDPEWSADKYHWLARDVWSFDPAFVSRYMRSIAKAGYPTSK
jgi:adenylate cyclase